MSKLDRILVEALLFKGKTPPTKKTGDISLKQYIKFKREFDEFSKLLKDETDLGKLKDEKKKAESLTFWQRVVLLHIGAVAYLMTLSILFRLTFH